MDMRGRGTLGSLKEVNLIFFFKKKKKSKGVLDGSRETLVALGVVVLETNLELNGLDKVAFLLASGICQEALDGPAHARH